MAFRRTVTKRKLLTEVATLMVCLAILFASLPEDQKLGPIILFLILAPVFWWLGERGQQKSAARPVPRRFGPH